MRQQRCGYNPYLGTFCHQKDGKTVYGPMPDGTVIDATGGWHDAGDQLKYLITASNATARMLLAYELEKDKFADNVTRSGRNSRTASPMFSTRQNGDSTGSSSFIRHRISFFIRSLTTATIADSSCRKTILPIMAGVRTAIARLFCRRQTAGPEKWKGSSTGVANLAGRSAAAMAMAYRIWKNDLHDDAFAERCLKAALELYAMGQKQEGYQQGNSFGAPYRYNENTWADDMEWAAAELYIALRKPPI